MNYITIYFKEEWHVSGLIDGSNFNWTCKSKESANSIAKKLIRKESL